MNTEEENREFVLLLLRNPECMETVRSMLEYKSPAEEPNEPVSDIHNIVCNDAKHKSKNGKKYLKYVLTFLFSFLFYFVLKLLVCLFLEIF